MLFIWEPNNTAVGPKTPGQREVLPPPPDIPNCTCAAPCCLGPAYRGWVSGREVLGCCLGCCVEVNQASVSPLPTRKGGTQHNGLGEPHLGEYQEWPEGLPRRLSRLHLPMQETRGSVPDLGRSHRCRAAEPGSRSY